MRVRSYAGLRNLVALVGLVFYFVSVELGRKLKLKFLLKRIYEKAQRFYEVPVFKAYAIADGIHKLLFAYRGRLAFPPLAHATGQLLLHFESLPP